jgi:hypothetical protein
MSPDAVLIMDPGGKIVWANRRAHELVSLRPGGLLGKNYLEYCPVDTHGDLLRLHRRKLEGESVRLRMDLGGGRVLAVTSGPVRVEERLYLYSVGRLAVGKPAGDETLVGLLAVGELLKERRIRIDLNNCLLGALKDEARSLRGRLRLHLGETPLILARPWPLRQVLRRLLLQAPAGSRRADVSTGGDADRAWVTITTPTRPHASPAELRCCRLIAKEHGGSLSVRGRVLRLTLPAA